MTPEQFVEKWKGATLSERAASHEHFLDLCNLLNEPTPAQRTTPSKNPSTPPPPLPKVPKANTASLTSGNETTSHGNTNAKANTKTSPKLTTYQRREFLI